MSQQTDYSLFQKWVILQLFDGRQKPRIDLVRNCCDSAINDALLEDDGIENEFTELDVDNIIDYFQGPNYAITEKGILYARRHLFKPFTDLLDRSDGREIFNQLQDGPVKESIRAEFEADAPDKNRLVLALKQHGTNHMSTYIQILQTVLQLYATGSGS